MEANLPSDLIPVIDTDPFEREALLSPWQFHAQLRDAGEVAYLSRHGVYAMGRYRQVHDALTDWQHFRSAAGVGIVDSSKQKAWREPSPLIEADPPYHDASRRVLTQIIGPRTLKALRQDWSSDADKLVDDIVGRRAIDGVAELAEAFPLRVFPDAVGVPSDGRENLVPYGNFGFNTVGPANQQMAQEASSIEQISTWIDQNCSRDVLTNDGFGAQIWAAADRGKITDRQAALLVRSLLTAGVDTTISGIAAVLYSVASQPDAWASLREDPSRVRTAFDEAVRLQSPVQVFFRTTTADVRVGEVVIPAETKVYLSLGAANRDPLRWANPDDFDLTRDPSGHVGFGMGIHQCLGQHIARLEAESLLTALLKRVRSIELEGEPTMRPNNSLRVWGSLPLRLEYDPV